MQKSFDMKISNLEVTVTRLEEKIKHQERLLEEYYSAEQQATKIHRTCHEARAADLSFDSGMYWIDPDGEGVGDDPNYVHCNKTTGNY